MAFILATNRKKETHFDYNAEDDTIEQWFSNFSLLRTPFTAPKAAADQARSQVLRFGGAQYIFRGAIFLFYFVFKTNSFVNFRRLTGKHIASCLSSVWSQQGRIQRGAIGAIAHPKTYESDFIHHDFVKFGKQHLRYKAILRSIVLSQQCCEVYFISLAVVNPEWDLTANITEIAPPPNITGWIHPWIT